MCNTIPTTKTSKDIVVERLFTAPIDMVWKALTVKELMKEWYFDLAAFKAEKGFKFEFRGGPSPEKQYLHLCEIIEVVSQKKLTYSWRYDGFEGNSYVTFELTKQGSQTLLKLTHTGIDTFPHSNGDFAIDNFKEGWNQIINTSLRGFLEPKND